MTENDSDLVVRLHREAVEADLARKARHQAQVEAQFERAVQRQRDGDECEQALIEHVHRKALELDRTTPAASSGTPRGVHYTELPEATTGQPLAEEWNTYRREVGRWLGEGQEGRHVLIKGQDIVGFFDTFELAYQAGLKQFAEQGFFVHSIRAEEPYVRVRGMNFPWPLSLSR
jgi:hypothetical protein